MDAASSTRGGRGLKHQSLRAHSDKSYSRHWVRLMSGQARLADHVAMDLLMTSRRHPRSALAVIGASVSLLAALALAAY